MKLCIVGIGYVGLVSGACFAQLGHQVICVDHNIEKIQQLSQGNIPFYEPGLAEMVKENLEKATLSFTQSLQEGVEQSNIIFIAVGTPSLPNGEVDMSQVETVAKKIGQFMNGYKIVVTKSTVPVGTGNQLRKLIQENLSAPQNFSMASNPEFLREGSAITDTMQPERIVIGIEDQQAKETLALLHQSFSCPLLITDIPSAEMIKHASNAFLATKISFINEIANICEKTGANVEEVAKGMGMDSRIGNKFLNAGIGYGGSCFPKDTKALVKIAGKVNHNFKLLQAVIEVNNKQRQKVVERLEKALGSLEGRTIAILGLAFKPNTDDIREAPSLHIIQEIQKRGGNLKVYDPVAMKKAEKYLSPPIIYCSNAYEALTHSHGVILVTEWQEFRELDLLKVKELLLNPVFIDGRNVFDPHRMREIGFYYCAIGR